MQDYRTGRCLDEVVNSDKVRLRLQNLLGFIEVVLDETVND